MTPRPLVTTALLVGLLACAAASAAPELSAAYAVHLSSAQRASDNDTWACGGAGPTANFCGTTSGIQASASFDQWGHQAGASATPGTLRAWAYAEWPDLTSSPRFATAQAQIVDLITLRHPDRDPGFVDRTGTLLRVRFSVAGELDYNDAGTSGFTTVFSASAPSTWFRAARFEATRNARGTASAGHGAFDEYQWPAAATGSPFGLFETTVRMPYNAPITLTWTLRRTPACCRRTTAGRQRAGALDHTDFLGIDVVEWDGDLLRRVDGASIVSASGYDWATPVPEPATLWLFAAGLLVAAARFRARAGSALAGGFAPQRALARKASLDIDPSGFPGS